MSLPNDPRQPSYSLTFDDAIEIWLLHWQGHFKQRISGHFDVNVRRVYEVLNEETHIGSREAALSQQSA